MNFVVSPLNLSNKYHAGTTTHRNSTELHGYNATSATHGDVRDL